MFCILSLKLLAVKDTVLDEVNWSEPSALFYILELCLLSMETKGIFGTQDVINLYIFGAE